MYASVQNWKLAEIFFTKDRMAPEEDRFNSYNTKKKNNFTGKQKSHKSLFESLLKNA